jgi:DNA-binding transcriptional LysR family regulator
MLAGAALVPAALAGFRRQHPQVRLSMLDIEPPEGYGLITSGDLDLLITHRYPGVPLPAARGLRRLRLMHDPLRVVLPLDHPAAGAPRLALTALTADEWVCGGPDAPNRTALEHAARRAGSKPRVAYETRDYAVTLALVSAGIGVALVPDSVLRFARTGRYAVRDLDPPMARQIFVVHRPRPRPPISDMVAHLEDASAAPA